MDKERDDKEPDNEFALFCRAIISSCRIVLQLFLAGRFFYFFKSLNNRSLIHTLLLAQHWTLTEKTNVQLNFQIS